ncbi:hypothetical protein GCM10009543_03180 [Leifsonia naganoensis]
MHAQDGPAVQPLGDVGEQGRLAETSLSGDEDGAAAVHRTVGDEQHGLAGAFTAEEGPDGRRLIVAAHVAPRLRPAAAGGSGRDS